MQYKSIVMCWLSIYGFKKCSDSCPITISTVFNYMVHKIYLLITKINIFFLHIQHLFHCFEIASSIFDRHFLLISVHNKIQMTGQNAKASNSIDLHFSHTLPVLLITIIDTKYCQIVSLWKILCSGYDNMPFASWYIQKWPQKAHDWCDTKQRILCLG